MRDFERQSEMMDMKEEILNDTIDEAMGDEGDEEESDNVVAQVTSLENLKPDFVRYIQGVPDRYVPPL